jgi:hypothetical protein
MAKEAIECCVLGMQDMGEAPPVEGAHLPLRRSAVTGMLFGYRITVDLQREAAQVA